MIFDSCLESLLTNDVSVLDFQTFNQPQNDCLWALYTWCLEHIWTLGCNAASCFYFFKPAPQNIILTLTTS